jgi:hypothetical protein
VGGDHDERLFDVAVYAMDALSPEEALAVEDHISGCAVCQRELAQLREVAAALGDVPAEALMDGPPEDADLLIRRTLRQIRAENGQGTAQVPSQARPSEGRVTPLAARPRGRVRPRDLGVAAAAVIVAVVAGGVIGRGTAPGDDVAIVRPQTQPSASATVVAGTRQGSATDTGTGAELTTQVVPAAGWVRVSAATAGIKAGQTCTLFVVAKDGTRFEAGSWLVSAANADKGTTVQGSAAVAPAQVAAVEVRNAQGHVLVRTEV